MEFNLNDLNGKAGRAYLECPRLKITNREKRHIFLLLDRRNFLYEYSSSCFEDSYRKKAHIYAGCIGPDMKLLKTLGAKKHFFYHTGFLNSHFQDCKFFKPHPTQLGIIGRSPPCDPHTWCTPKAFERVAKSSLLKIQT